MLRWLRSPGTAWRLCTQRRSRPLLNWCLLLMLLLASVPVPVLGETLPAAQQAPQPQQQSVPQTLNFVNNVAQVQSTASLNQNQVYLFFGTQGQRVQIQLSSTPSGANFELRGANNTVYKSFADPQLDWSFTLPEAQNYRITINSPVPVVFTMVVTLGGSSTPQRITFLPGQTSTQVTGMASPGQSPQYVFTASAGQTLRVVLLSPGNAANFSVRGVTDNQIYKSPADPSRDWTTVLTANQDYLVTITAPVVTSFTLQLYLSGPQPGQAERINFLPGQSSTTVSGILQPNVPKLYVFYAGGGTIRLLLSSQPAGSANFSVVGVTDGFTYKQATDPAREWSYPISVAQDYLVTVFSPVTSSYVLEVNVPIPTPITPVTPTNTPGTPVPTVPAGCTTDTIQNGGFEVDGFWLFGDDPVPAAYSSTTTHTPLRSMRLGIDPALGPGFQNRKSFSSIRQPFQIPTTASIAQLRWWNFYRTEEGQTDTPGIDEDRQQVVLLNPDLTTVAVLRNVRRNTAAWQEELVDLTPYRGKPLLLYFNVYNDGNGQRTWQFLDDVVINVCYPAVTATPSVPTPVPTMFPTMGPPVTIMPTLMPTPLITAVLPTILPTLIATVAGEALLTPLANGEPVVIELPRSDVKVAVVPPQAQAQVKATVATAVSSQARMPEVFNRPLNEVLTWAGVMLGALAVIGIIVALIWQASSRRSEP